MKRTPIKRKSAKPRRTTSPRCKTRSCNARAEIQGWCVKHAEQVADRKFSLEIRTRDNRCTAAGVLQGECKGGLQAAHVVGRRNHAVRYDPENVHALCMAHHITVDQHGQEHAKHIWITSVIGVDAYDFLVTRALAPVKRRTSIENYLGGSAHA